MRHGWTTRASPQLGDLGIERSLGLRVTAERPLAAVAREYESILAPLAENLFGKFAQRHHLLLSCFEFLPRDDPADIGRLLPAHRGHVLAALCGQKQRA